MSRELLCPAPERTTDAAFLRVLDLRFVAELVSQHLLQDASLIAIEPAYVRWKDRDGSLLGFRVQVRVRGEQRPSYVTVRTAVASRLATEFERIAHRRDKIHDGLRACAHLPHHGVLLVAYPLDRGIRELRHLVRASKVRGLLMDHCPGFLVAGLRISKANSEGTLISYKPERRAVLRWQVGLMDETGQLKQRPSVWLRCHANPQANRTTLATTAAAAAGIPCPVTLGIAHDRLMVESHVEGVGWRPFAIGAGAEGSVDATTKVATTVARLHGVECPKGLPVHSMLRELDMALRCADDLDRLDPSLGSVALQLADDLSAIVPHQSKNVLSHGDLHSDQALLADQAALVDFDRACLAPAAHDLATLRAQLLARDPHRGPLVWREFVVAYGRHSVVPDAMELHWWTACALLRLAIGPFRALHPSWPEKCAAILRTACAVASMTAGEKLA
ncbi:MAG: aminoglycoside phosphotransferase [Planctomycetota bacterium]|jgi:aminoglycoside phosphotransferase